MLCKKNVLELLKYIHYQRFLITVTCKKCIHAHLQATKLKHYWTPNFFHEIVLSVF